MMQPRRTLSLFRGHRLKPAWRFTVKGVLWRIAVDDTGHLIGEERDAERKKASFFCLDRESGQALWTDRRFSEEWWIGIEGFRGGILYLHGFLTPELPGHRGLTAIDVPTGKTLWENSDFMFVAAHEDRLYVFQGGIIGGRLLELDPRSGEVRRTLGADDATVNSIKEEARKAYHEEAEIPLPFPGSEEETSSVARLVRQRDELRQDADAIEYIDHATTPVFVYSIRREGKEQSVLEVVDRASGKILLSEVLSSGMPWSVQETVFVFQDRLFYVSDRKTLTAVPLGVR